MKQLRYTQKFAQLDDDGSKQLAAEESIAGQLFFDYEEQDVLGHTLVIIRQVAEAFCLGAVPPVTSVLESVRVVYDYLRTWKKNIDSPTYGPHEGEAGKAGKDLLILVVRLFCPEYVEEVEVDEAETEEEEESLTSTQFSGMSFDGATRKAQHEG
jgi:hypothetical protein